MVSERLTICLPLFYFGELLLEGIRIHKQESSQQGANRIRTDITLSDITSRLSCGIERILCELKDLCFLPYLQAGLRATIKKSGKCTGSAIFH